MEQQMHKDRDAISNLKPKTAFKAGLLTGLGIMFVVGFFVLLGFVLTKDKDSGNNANSDTNKVVNNGDTGNNEIKITPYDENNDWIRGKKNAKLTIYEFSDVDCPFCSRFHDTMMQVTETYGDDVAWVYRHFPLNSLHPEAQKKAEASECVGDLGGNDKFWEFLDEIFAQEGETVADLANIASSVGVNSVAFQECLDSGKFTSKVQNQARQAQAAGGQGTPYSIVVAGDTKIPIPGALPFSSIQTTLDSLLK